MPKHWKPDELAKLDELLDAGMTYADMAKEINRTPVAIETKAYAIRRGKNEKRRQANEKEYRMDAQLGLSVSNTRWREDENDMLRAHPKMPAEVLARHLGRTPIAVQKQKHRLGLTPPVRYWDAQEDYIILTRTPRQALSHPLLEGRRTPDQLQQRKYRIKTGKVKTDARI